MLIHNIPLKMHKLHMLTQKPLLKICQLKRNFSYEKATFNLSYISNCTEEPFVPYTIGKLLDNSADKYSIREAVVVRHQNIRKNFADLKKESDKLAAGFVAVGLKKGDRIGIWSQSNYQWIVTQFAAAKAGLILVCVNPLYQQRELEYCINKVGMKSIVMSDVLKSQNYYEILRSAIPSLTSSKAGEVRDEKLPDLSHIIMISDADYKGTFKFNDVMEAADSKSLQELEKVEQTIQFDDPANIQFTSGTTGNPKGATLSHYNIVNMGNFCGKSLGFNNKLHRVCLPTPLYHSFGNILGVISTVYHGSCSIIPFETYQPRAIADTIQEEKTTIMYGTPTMYSDVLNLKNFNDYDFTSLEIGMIGGANTPKELLRKIQDQMHIPNLKHGFGCTEMTAGVFRTNPLTLEKAVVLGPLEIKIVDDNDHIVDRGKGGELCLRGYNTMLGYWNDPEKTKEVITDSKWYKTGDMATMAENEHIEIIGRKKEMIIRGGENIFPQEIENFLHTHPDIVDAQVIGVPDERMGEELCVWIQLKAKKSLTAEDIKSFCKGQLAQFKIPRYVLFVDNYPKTITGKVQKWKMLSESEKLLGLNMKTA